MIISVPFLIAAVVITSVMLRGAWYIVAVFLLGIAYDVMTLQRVGQTSLYLLGIVILVELYDRKFETRTMPFVLGFCFAAASLYLIFFGSYAFFVQLLLTLGFAFLFYLLFVRLGYMVKDKS